MVDERVCRWASYECWNYEQGEVGFGSEEVEVVKKLRWATMRSVGAALARLVSDWVALARGELAAGHSPSSGANLRGELTADAGDLQNLSTAIRWVWSS